MTTSFKAKSNVNIGIAGTVIYTAGVGLTAILRALTIANITAAEITVSVEFTDSSAGVTSRIVKDAPIPVGGSIVPISSENQQNFETGDSIKVLASVNNGCDSTLSYIEIA